MKPIVRWVGGKTALCDILESQLPITYQQQQYIPKYFEPFVGGASFLLDLLTKGYEISYIYISDINKDLILLYNIIRDYPEEFINNFQNKIDKYKDCYNKEKYYYHIRALYNQDKTNLIETAVYFVLLNKMCFNSLYRLNQNGEFNVSYNHKHVKNPSWLNEDNIYKISHALHDAHILHTDYVTSLKFVDNNSFLYLDIPYDNSWRYNTETNNLILFNEYCKACHQKGAYFLCSNFDNHLAASYPLYTYEINKYHPFDRKIKDEILIRNYEV